MSHRKEVRPNCPSHSGGVFLSELYKRQLTDLSRVLTDCAQLIIRLHDGDDTFIFTKSDDRIL